MKARARFWNVKASIPTPVGGAPDRTYMREDTIGVVAMTIEDAIAATYDLHPGCRVWSVNHRGEVHTVATPPAGAGDDAGEG